MTGTAESPGPGWYDDPNDPNTRRYWDGQAWTDSRTPKVMAPAVPPVGSVEKAQAADGIIIAGYIFAVLFPFVGFFIGLSQINKNRHGIWVVVVSVIAFIVWLAIITSSASSGGSGSY